MKKFLLLAIVSLAFADMKTSQIVAIDAIIQTYKSRLACLENNEANFCIDKFPLDQRSDTLAKTFAMSFPKAFYASKLQRDIKILEKQKLCFGRAVSEIEAKKCFNQF
ncbi:hypothetical protein [Nitratiruptor sp. YY09-18]|uniref:hypothetical protein n=1 Tax=Nitratiruptor sp. YY09-18 TaxID=2724901 RepID=UPI001914EC4C|nr:hypothetical protein [Nitratiruptor sp. YY09-18]BCD67810.1 hypothetical protein NitYY0918_C0717 [Nitratiruptor sp. YY09-18]